MTSRLGYGHKPTKKQAVGDGVLDVPPRLQTQADEETSSRGRRPFAERVTAMTDYYTVLGVSADADAETIKTAYRRLAKESHPDLHPGNKETEARFKLIGEAWDILSDSKKRAKYDAERAPKKTTQKPKTPVGNVDFSKVMSQFDSFFGKAVTPATGGKQQENPLDATDLFEKYMGIKK